MKAYLLLKTSRIGSGKDTPKVLTVYMDEAC
jgi:hypothetical protein